MTTTLGSQCLQCRHFRSPLDEPDGQGRTCAAFPGQIPNAIWRNQTDHRNEYAGDGGIRWEGEWYPEYALAANRTKEGDAGEA